MWKPFGSSKFYKTNIYEIMITMRCSVRVELWRKYKGIPFIYKLDYDIDLAEGKRRKIEIKNPRGVSYKGNYSYQAFSRYCVDCWS